MASMTDPTPDGYTFIPKGDQAITSMCRYKTFAQGGAVYIVHDKNGKRTGIHVPTVVHDRVRKVAEKTKMARMLAAIEKKKKLKTQLCQAIRSQFPRLPKSKLLRTVADYAMKDYNPTHKLTMAEKAFTSTISYIRYRYTHDMNVERDIPLDECLRRVSDAVDEKALEWGWGPEPEPNAAFLPTATELEQKLRRIGKRSGGRPSLLKEKA
ncbi:hypothetical protein GGS26DRAFT_594582 [Hypomontagnella submonticulosa]|nr:hypothetical protein GGS26DRAFT_594582 [Hypomontagnella submonticulosa]